jgi:phosphatidylserine decarboxylase
MAGDNIVDSVKKILEKLFILLQYILPHHLLSRLMHWLARNEWRPLKELLINQAIKLYDVDMSIASEQDPYRYNSFNHFFTRQLQPQARPIARARSAVASPVDGVVSQTGAIEDGNIFQAKGHYYSLVELLGGDADLASEFTDGSFTTIYLSPKDYHRIHIPLAGTLKKMLHVPGRLFSVSPATTRAIPNLFSRNERVVSIFDTTAGPMAVIMVGAIFVASMDTVWAGTVTPSHQRVQTWEYGKPSAATVRLKKGEEMGRFNMGSTVIVLFGRDAVKWTDEMQPDSSLKMGQKIATITNS